MEKIIVYYKEGSSSCERTIEWFKKHDCIIEFKKIENITHREVFQLLYLSGLEIPDILKKTKKYSISLNKLKKRLKKLRFSEGLYFLEQHPEILEVPIILSNEYSLSGYDEDKIKHFL